MSGYISVSSEKEWQATSWMFRFVATFIADNAESNGLASQINEMIEYNLPYFLELDILSASDRDTVLKILRDDVVRHAEASLNQSLPNRQSAIDHIRELAQLARSVPA